MIAGVNDETGKTTEAYILGDGGEGHFRYCDVAVMEDVEGLVKETLQV